MQARSDQRMSSASGLGAGTTPNNTPFGHVAHGPFQYNMQGSTYAQLMNAQIQNGQMQLKETNNQMDNLTQALGGVHIHGIGNLGTGRVGGNSIPAGLMNVPALNHSNANGPVYYQLPDGRVFVSNVNASTGTYQQSNGAFNITPAQAQYLQQASFHMSQTMPNVQQSSHTWSGNQQYTQEVPELSARRRNSLSSNEETGPHTPFFGAQNRADYQPKISATDISPQAWTTPSPESIGQSFYPQPLAKTPDGQYVFCDLDGLCRQDPEIPKPVPAIFSGEKGRGTLEKSLHNQLNTTNVYIRGLHPNTTDEMLHAYGARFGDIISAKSMLDQQTGLCKGFGFIKYHDFTTGENCIRGFFHWGYEAKWARVSHNEKLKTLSDADNTNLYISGLPLTYNEHTLKAIFEKYDCLSSKILRDPNGLSRGVGFARFAAPEICNQIIQEYNGKSIGTEGHILGVRYSDTQAQKHLKTVTAERRQYKTMEYNSAVFGNATPFLPSPTAASFASPLQPRVPGANAFWPTQAQISPLYQAYPQVAAPFHAQGIPAMSSTRSAENAVPSNTRYNSRIKIESPSAVALAKRTRDQGELVGGSVSSPSTVSAVGDDDVICNKGPGHLSQSTAKPSPSKSLLSRSSPCKSVAGNRLVQI